MTPHKEFQSFFILDYTSKFSHHRMKICTRLFSNSGFLDPGTFPTWNGGTIAGDTMVEDWASAIQQIVPDTTTIDGYTIYRKSSDDDPGVPAFSKQLGGSGLSIVSGWEEAVQQTFVFRTTGYAIAKVVTLDVRSENLFGRYTVLSGDYLAMAELFMDGDHGFAGRDGNQPAVFKVTTTNLNEKLRREYHIS